MQRLLCLLLLPLALFAQEDKSGYYYYRPEVNYGSEAVFSPVSMFLNGSLDILRNGSHENNGESKSLLHLDYRNGIHNVWRNISHPLENIEAYGWKNFISREIFPIAPSRDRSQYVPNYLHHVVGAGMLYVKTSEWFQYHGYPLPRIHALLVTQSYQFMNEVLENNHFRGPNVDPIADMLIFNPLGYLLFSFDTINGFFSNTICLYDWSLQPQINPFSWEMENAGQQFVATFDLPYVSTFEGFFYWGTSGIGGLSYKTPGEGHFSFGAGTVVNRLEENRIKRSRFLSPVTDGALGFFYDRKRSLLASVIITMPRFYNARINIYPGVLDILSLKTGFYVALGEVDGFKAGISLAALPVGLLAGRQ